MKKLLGTGVATLAILAGSATVATPASAYAGQQKCATSGIFRICNKTINAGYDVSVTNNGTNPDQARILDFNLQCQGYHYGDQGAFWASPGSTHTYLFEVPHQLCYPKVLVQNPLLPNTPAYWISISSLTLGI
ncbi:hypothetical protein [Kitasatospora indigofera]|uniref:hypothetical protein n=1 Tax=Kitasatospora indigofera TaxID=67307 RepID=UPI0033ACD443